MAFLGSHILKCKVCEKRVFFTEQLTVDGATFHRACFKCKQCETPLETHSYSSIEGSLYCKQHVDEQSPAKTANVPLTMETTPVKPSAIQRLQSELLKTPSDLPRTPSKAASFKFLGTQDKCVTCTKTVYPLEKVSVEGSSYHKACFKCLQGGCSISPSNYAAMEGRIYCKHHFKQLFKEKGNYSQLLVKMPSAKIPEQPI